MHDDTIICRCEEVRWGDIRDAVEHGLLDPGDIRKYTRAGMGSCQGRTCRRLLMQQLKQMTGKDLSLDNTLRPRIPIQSMTVGELARYRQGPEDSQ